MKSVWRLGLSFAAVFTAAATEFDYRATAVFPHVDRPFTQGLAVKFRCEHSVAERLDDCLAQTKTAQCYESVLNACVTLYESSGLYDRSFVRVISDFHSGRPERELRLAPQVFAEGLDLLNNDEHPLFVVASWHERRLLVFKHDQDGLRKVNELFVAQPLEHWGLATDRRELMWMTSGSSTLFEFDIPRRVELRAPVSRNQSRRIQAISPIRKVKLTCNGKEISHVNELEYDPDRATLWGNVWMSSMIYEFNVTTGACVSTLDIHSDPRLKVELPPADLDAVWNGLAAIGNGWFFITGKRFSKVYLTKILPNGTMTATHPL